MPKLERMNTERVRQLVKNASVVPLSRADAAAAELSVYTALLQYISLDLCDDPVQCAIEALKMRTL